MEIVIVDDDAAVGEVAASIIARRVAIEPTSVIGLATGSSPLSTYRCLIEAVDHGDLSFLQAQAVMLDEYVGLDADHPEAYRSVLRRELVGSIDLPIESLHGPDANADDLPGACEAYDSLLARLGVDVQLLGIGTDGHVGFNEPSSSLRSRTRIKTLTDQTRHDNARFFDSVDDVPRHVVTQGLATIGEARQLVLVAMGESKAAPVAAAVEGPLSASCPASVVQLHPHATIIVDEAAARDLRRHDYYRSTYRHKPRWQAL